MKDQEKWIHILGEDYFAPNVYRDEPILRTAATMKNYMPQQYRDMRNLAFQNGRHSFSPEEIFYRQAKFMEDFEDEFVYTGEFVRYFPTYQSMSSDQLRGYFSWRTQVRRGMIRKTSLSFVFIYLYELINVIGSKTPQEGYDVFRAFCDTYSGIDMRIRRYTQLWLRDYVVYYGLDESLLADYFDMPEEQALAVLQAYTDASDEALFPAVCACSSYTLERSRFYRDYTDDVRDVVCRVYRAYAAFYAGHRKYDLFTSVFGRSFTTPYTMFSSAIFCPQERRADTVVTVGPYTSFACRDGKWTFTKLWNGADSKREIGSLLRAVDAMMRQDAGYAHAIKCADTPKYLQKIITDCIAAHKADKRQREAREVRIDVTKLQGIRDAADVTRDRLIVEEEPDEPEFAQPAPEPAEAAERPFGLDETEYAVLRALLYGEDAQAVLRGKNILLSVVTDGINEKCFDTFADTVLVFDGDVPQVLEDYTEELKGYIS